MPSHDRGPGGWLWIAIIIVIIVVFWFAVGGRSRHQALANPAQNQQNPSNPVTDVTQLSSVDAPSLVGRPAQFARAPVDQNINGGAFFIDSNGTPVLVVKAAADNAPPPGTAMAPTETTGGVWKKDHVAAGEQVHESGAGQFADRGKGTPESGGNAAPLTNEHAGAYNRGDLVSIQGTIRQMPSEHDAMIRFNLSTSDAARAARSKLYIEAGSVQPAAK